MADKIDLKEDFRLALCCNPLPGDDISGFLKPDSGVISVHKKGCRNLESIQPDRLVELEWDEILAEESNETQDDNSLIERLDEIDLRILRHHAEMGVDYAAVVAKSQKIGRALVFERHRKLRDLGLLARVQPRIIQYRKNIVDNKWIKHRNHTYYEITERGRRISERCR